jgi:uncharacterized protein YukE
MVCVTVSRVAKGVPVGDVQGMRKLADQLAAAAREVAAAGDHMRMRSTNFEYEGAAAKRLHAWANVQYQQAGLARNKLNELAEYLRREATALEQAQATTPSRR